MILLATTLILTAACVSRADQDSRTADVGASTAQRRAWALPVNGLHQRSRAAVREHCPATVKAITYYRKAYTASRTAMGLAGAVPRVWYQQCPALRERAVSWRDKAKTARLEFAVWKRDNFEWWRWMPRGSKWYRVASCETGYGRDPNWQHDSGTYVSAFGIYRPGYADDAHRVGNMSWDETVRVRGTVPTPREQYEAAVSHYNAHGGFSGWGCRGA